MTTKIHASLKSASEEKGNDAIGKSVPTFTIDPRVIVVEPGFNARPIDPAHVAYLEGLMEAGVDVGYLLLQMIDGKATLRDGEHRWTAYMNRIAKGVDIKRVKALEFKGDEKAARYAMMATQSGMSYTPLQLGEQYKIMMNKFGDSYAEIAKERGMSVQHVKDAIRLTEQPVEMKELINSGTVKAATALKLIKKEGVKAATATIKEGIVVAKGKPITQKVIDNLAKNVVSDAAKRTATAKEHLAAMLDSPAFDGPTKAVLTSAVAIMDGKRPPVADTKPIVEAFLAHCRTTTNEHVMRAGYILTDVLNGKALPVEGSPSAQAYGNMVWLQDMAATSKEPTFRAAAHWFMAVLDAKRTKRDLAPAPSVLSLEDALRMEMESNGNALAETLCEEHAALIMWARGRA